MDRLGRVIERVAGVAPDEDDPDEDAGCGPMPTDSAAAEEALISALLRFSKHPFAEDCRVPLRGPVPE